MMNQEVISMARIHTFGGTLLVENRDQGVPWRVEWRTQTCHPVLEDTAGVNHKEGYQVKQRHSRTSEKYLCKEGNGLLNHFDETSCSLPIEQAMLEDIVRRLLQVGQLPFISLQGGNGRPTRLDDTTSHCQVWWIKSSPFDYQWNECIYAERHHLLQLLKNGTHGDQDIHRTMLNTGHWLVLRWWHNSSMWRWTVLKQEAEERT